MGRVRYWASPLGCKFKKVDYRLAPERTTVVRVGRVQLRNSLWSEAQQLHQEKFALYVTERRWFLEKFLAGRGGRTRKRSRGERLELYSTARRVIRQA